MTFAARSRAVLTLLLGSLVTAFLLITPAAHAQLPGLEDPVGSVVDTVDDVVGSVGGAAEAAGDTVTDTAGDVTDATGDVVGTVDNSTSVVNKDGEEGGLIGDVLYGVVGEVNDTVKKTVETVEDTSEEVVKDLQGALKGKPRSDSFNSNGDVRTVGSSGSPKKERDGSREFVGGNQVADPSSRLGDGAARNLTGVGNPRPIVPIAEIQEPSTGFSEIVRQAAEATKKLAFPLALSLLVVAFLMMQGRVDGRDPKLAYAPMDAEQELLSFK